MPRKIASAQNRASSRARSRSRSLVVHRKAYTRKDGTRVKAATYTIRDVGTPGRQSRGAKSGPHSKERPFIQRKGKLGGAGYLSKSARQRHALLDACVREYGLASCRGSVSVLNRNSVVRAKHGPTIDADLEYLRRKYSK